MLYSEFLKGTRAPETPDTYDQFQIIGQIYEDCEGMTKEEAYRIWKQTYGRELKRRELRQRERLELLINREDYDSADRPHRAAIYHELSTLFWAAYYNKDGSRCRLATEGRCFTDVYGITWILRYDGRYGKAPGGAVVTVITGTPYDINISAHVEYEKNVDRAEVLQQFTELVTEYVKSRVFNRNDDTKELSPIAYKKIAAILGTLSGVANYDDLTVNGGTADITIEPYEIPTVKKVSLT